MAHRDPDKKVHHGQERPYRFHAFVCTKGPECPTDGAADTIRARLKSLVKQRGLADAVRINNSGCLGQCGHGPMMVTYPDGVWYSHVTPDDVEAIFAEHIIAGHPVDRLRYRLGPGGVKAQRDETGTTTCDGKECHE